MSSLQTAGRGYLAPLDAFPDSAKAASSGVFVWGGEQKHVSQPRLASSLASAEPRGGGAGPGVEKVTFRTGHKSPRSSSSSCGLAKRAHLNGKHCVSDPRPHSSLMESPGEAGARAPLLSPRPCCQGPWFLFRRSLHKAGCQLQEKGAGE